MFWVPNNARMAEREGLEPRARPDLNRLECKQAMAEHAHITPPPSRRRTLFAAAGAVILGSGITAGAAASVADLVPADRDADLIRLCDEFIRLELHRRAIFDGPTAIEDDDQADAASLIVSRQMNRVLERIEVMRAVSADGVLAMAQALWVEDSDFHGSSDVESVPGRLLTCLLRDAAGIGARQAS